MRLPVEKIKAAILHPDPDVREAAVFYFARSYSPDPTIMPLAIKAVGRHGLDAFEIPTFFQSLKQTDATVAWLIQEIERVSSSAEEREESYASALVAAVSNADPAVLKNHEVTIKAMRRLDDSAKDAVADRIRLNSFSPDALWQKLTEFCEEQEELESVSDEAFEHAGSIIVAMSRHPDQFADKVMALLTDTANVCGGWLEGLSIRLAGEMRLEAAIPPLINRLREIGEWLGEEAQEALTKMGADAVVQGIVGRYAGGDWDFRTVAASLLEDIHTDLSVETCLDLLGSETDAELRGRLIQSILMNFSPAGIEPARQHVLNTPKSPDALEVRTDLLVACKVLGETFPEFEAWLQDSKHDVEFRRQWYKEHYVTPDSDEDESEDDELGDDDDFPIERPPDTIIRRGERVGRNDPCPCGSGKKYKKCCYGKEKVLEETDEGHSFAMSGLSRGKSSAKYPIGTIAFYGPDNRTTTKIAAGVVKREGAEAIVERWVGRNIKDSPKAQKQMMAFFERHKVESVVASDGNIGCPHEEGIDFPSGEDCPFCPYWAGKQGSNRRD